VIATVTLNPSLDLTVSVDRLVVDDVIRMKGIRKDPGGKGINVSRVVNTLGGATIAYGFIGGHEGGALSVLLAEEGILTSFIAIEGDTRINIIISEMETGTQTRINAEGPRVKVEDLDRLRSRLWKMGGLYCAAQFMVFAGSIPPGLPRTTYRDLMEEARERGIKPVLDTDGEALKQGVKAKPYMIKPNTYELERLVGRELRNAGDQEIVEAAREVLDMGVEVVAVTRGKKNAVLVTQNKVYLGIPPKVKTVSAVGAGDSFVAAFLLAVLQGKGFAEAFRWGLAAGSATAMTPGTELLNLEDFHRLLPEAVVEEV